jgi:hypothetical protein
MGIVVTKSSYKSIPFDNTEEFSSINIASNYPYDHGMSVVQKSLHREHFSRVLAPTSTRGIAAGRNAKQVSATTR